MGDHWDAGGAAGGYGEGGFGGEGELGGGFFPSEGASGEEHYEKKKKKKDKKQKKSREEPLDLDPSAGFGGGTGPGLDGFEDEFGRDDSGPPAMSTSAIETALERQRRVSPESQDAGTFDFDRGQGHSADAAIAALAVARGGVLGLDSASPGGEIRRGFSFSLQDMADDFSPADRRGPVFEGKGTQSAQHGASRQKWNPLAEISRHWEERSGEVAAIPPKSFVSPMTSRSELMAGSVPLPPSTFGGSGLLSVPELPPPANIEEELEQREDRVQALRTRIAELEADLGQSGEDTGKSPSGHLRIVVEHPINGETLGLTIKHMTVTEISDQRAYAFGWAVGDRILQVNGFPVTQMMELSSELSKAISSYKVASRPLIFDIYRNPVASLPTTHKAPVRMRRDCCAGPDDEPERMRYQPAATAMKSSLAPTLAQLPATAPVHPTVLHSAGHPAVRMPPTAPVQVVYQYPGDYAAPAQGTYVRPVLAAPGTMQPGVYQGAPSMYHSAGPVVHAAVPKTSPIVGSGVYYTQAPAGLLRT